MTHKKFEKAVIIGAGHGIGLSLTKALLEREPGIKIYASYRNADKAHELLELNGKISVHQLDPCEENELEQLAKQVASDPSNLGLVINCVAWLHTETMKPEKNLRQINMTQMLESFKVNSVVAGLLARYFLPSFRHAEECSFVSISAKVGSITDNNIGGWYGYRASKAAMNMILKTAAIEYARYNCRCNVLAIHPGTTVTQLSEPYIKNTKYKLHTPDETAANILAVIDQQTYSPEAKFLSWDNTKIEW